jgi:hypothetical protein
MKNFIEILRSLSFLSRDTDFTGAEARRAAVRALLEHRCPLCKDTLIGHQYGAFALFKLGGGKIMDRYAARETVLSASANCLPAEGANDPMSDIVGYAVLICPVRRDDVVMEHFSGADVYSEESIVVVPKVSKGRREEFIRHAYDWIDS